MSKIGIAPSFTDSSTSLNQYSGYGVVNNDIGEIKFKPTKREAETGDYKKYVVIAKVLQKAKSWKDIEKIGQRIKILGWDVVDLSYLPGAGTFVLRLQIEFDSYIKRTFSIMISLFFDNSIHNDALLKIEIRGTHGEARFLSQKIVTINEG